MIDKTTELEQTKKENHLSNYAKIAIKKWQEANQALQLKELEKAKSLFQEFHKILVDDMLGGSTGFSFSLEDLKVLSGKGLSGDSYLPLLSGTEGERIFFQTAFLHGDTDEIGKEDPIKWMIYPRPSSFGKECYESFVSHFGTNEVDLTQKID